MPGKWALLVGASGLVGGELLNFLLDDPGYSKVLVLARTPLGVKHSKLEEWIIDFENLDRYKQCFKVDDIFCCLGTTIKKAGSQAAFKKVDVEYPLEIARLGKEVGAKRFLVVTSLGSNPNSAIFYSRMKGLLEEKLKEIGFKSLHIFQPSLLLGNRKEFRFGESVVAILSKGISFVFVGSLKKYKPITAKTVARGMHSVAQSKREGINTYPSNEIAEL